MGLVSEAERGDVGAGGGESGFKCRLFRGFSGDGDREFEEKDLSVGWGLSSDLIQVLGWGELLLGELDGGCCIKQ